MVVAVRVTAIRH